MYKYIYLLDSPLYILLYLTKHFYSSKTSFYNKYCYYSSVSRCVRDIFISSLIKYFKRNISFKLSAFFRNKEKNFHFFAGNFANGKTMTNYEQVNYCFLLYLSIKLQLYSVFIDVVIVSLCLFHEKCVLSLQFLLNFHLYITTTGIKTDEL